MLGKRKFNDLKQTVFDVAHHAQSTSQTVGLILTINSDTALSITCGNKISENSDLYLQEIQGGHNPSNSTNVRTAVRMQHMGYLPSDIHMLPISIWKSSNSFFTAAYFFAISSYFSSH